VPAGVAIKLNSHHRGGETILKGGVI
jgi:hypothetical protein